MNVNTHKEMKTYTLVIWNFDADGEEMEKDYVTDLDVFETQKAANELKKAGRIVEIYNEDEEEVTSTFIKVW